jgi:hypothetical protein
MVLGAALVGAVSLPLLGTAIFLAWRSAMGFPAMNISMAVDWGRLVSTPWETIGMLALNFPTLAQDNWLILFNTPILLLAIGMLIAGWRQLPVELKVYQVTIILYLLSTHTVYDPLTSLNRYILLAFPLFLTMGTLSMSRAARIAVFGAGVFLSLTISGFFFLWKWIG